MRAIILFSALCLAFTSINTFAADEPGGPVAPEAHTPDVVMSRAVQAGVSPASALGILKAGNVRFVQGQALPRDVKKAMQATAHGQYPLAAVVGCMDSRVPVEMVFDQGLGDVFVVRVAGNVINADTLGSLEYAAAVAGAKAIVVLGHSSCGAVKGACDKVHLGNVTAVVDKIRPAVDKTPGKGDRSSKNHDFVNAVARNNVQHSLEQIRKQSPLLRKMETGGELVMVGGMYDLDSGKVQWF